MKQIMIFDTELLRQHRGTVLFEGILFLLLGISAIAMPVLYTLGIDFLLGVLFIVAGVAQCYRVMKTWGMQGSWPALFWSLLSVVTGVVMIARPMIGVLALTTLLIAYFFLESIIKMSMAIRFGSGSQKFWMVVSSLISLFLALLIGSGLPGTASWVLGLFVGIDLAIFGVMVLALWGALGKKA
ncbi:MAG TPA: DUF308 domain-containing protein [Chlamydiales bacterium]|nr:DUF308 domain-containing protein [Chlamydiales bacterium]